MDASRHPQQVPLSPTKDRVALSEKSSNVKLGVTLSPGKALESPLSDRRIVSPVAGTKRTFYEFHVDGNAYGRLSGREGLSKAAKTADEQEPRLVAQPVGDSRTSSSNWPSSPNEQEKSALEAQRPSQQSYPSFSSLINYNAANSSQEGNEEDSKAEDADAIAAAGIDTANLCASHSRAETLRLRLNLAMFKVQTNQTELPFSRLKISGNDSNQILFDEATMLRRAEILRQLGSASPESVPRSPDSQDHAAADAPHKSSNFFKATDGSNRRALSERPATPPLPSSLHRRPASAGQRAHDAADGNLTSSSVKDRAASSLLMLGTESKGHD